ncbi:NitT/TauT family transport system permease protein [Halopseudomonas xinjiangensis]|uniref:NitT/TauT family transport system permease protein n=2 Tax=Halopseudomonas xinjiangensis TaxID=487184 RepID=A0A1H1Y0G6_9GAMM|nr:NitT/TauT family transport system permease protein [Halopseudomonas xinjiangensis]
MTMKSNVAVAEPVVAPAPAPAERGPGAPALDATSQMEHHDTPPAAPAPAALRHATLEKARRYAVRTAALIMAVVIWHLASTNDFNLFVNFEHVPEPLTVGEAFLAELTGSEFYLHIAHSMQRIAIAYGLAVVLGVTLGVLMGRSKWAEDIILPYIELLRPIPAVAWIPLAILMLPSEQSSIVFITFLGALFPVVLNTVHGVEQTNGVLVRAARCLGASNSAILWHVIIPGAMPSIVTGLAVGMGVAWFSLLAGEIISGQYGIGYFTWTSYTLIQYPQIIIGMLTIGLLGTLSTLLVRLACSPLLRWQPKGARA